MPLCPCMSRCVPGSLHPMSVPLPATFGSQWVISHHVSHVHMCVCQHVGPCGSLCMCANVHTCMVCVSVCTVCSRGGRLPSHWPSGSRPPTQLLYTLTFWLLLRQFVKEKLLRKAGAPAALTEVTVAGAGEQAGQVGTAPSAQPRAVSPAPGSARRAHADADAAAEPGEAGRRPARQVLDLRVRRHVRRGQLCRPPRRLQDRLHASLPALPHPLPGAWGGGRQDPGRRAGPHGTPSGRSTTASGGSCSRPSGGWWWPTPCWCSSPSTPSSFRTSPCTGAT